VSLSLSDNKESFASDIAVEEAPSLTKELRRRARAAEWPSDIVNSLEVIPNGGSVSISYPEDIKAKVEDLEYGGISSMPNPVLRSFASFAAEYLASVLKNRVAQDFLDNGGIW
jgi:hypothetical protein